MGAQTLSNSNIEDKPITGRPSIIGWQCKLVKECVPGHHKSQPVHDERYYEYHIQQCKIT